MTVFGEGDALRDEVIRDAPSADEGNVQFDAFYGPPGGPDLTEVEESVALPARQPVTERAPRGKVVAVAAEPPGLRGLGRPQSWRAARAPESLLSAQYTSASRRAEEVLRATDGGGARR